MSLGFRRPVTSTRQAQAVLPERRGVPTPTQILRSARPRCARRKAVSTTHFIDVRGATRLFLVRQHEGPGRRKHPTHAVDEGDLAVGHLAGAAFATELAGRLDDG